VAVHRYTGSVKMGCKVSAWYRAAGDGSVSVPEPFGQHSGCNILLTGK
jgi:hypothetical protein